MSETQTIRENPFFAEAQPTLNPDAVVKPPSIAETLQPMASPQALGSAAVYNTLLAAEAGVTGNIKAQESRTKINEYELQSIRDFFSLIGDKQKSKIGSVLLQEEPPEWLMVSFGGPEAKPIDIITAITTTDETGEPTVSNDTFVNLLEWHNHVQGKKQEQFEAETIAPMRTVFTERLGAAVEQGWLPADALSEERLRLIAETPVCIDDGVGFDRAFHGMGTAMAYAHAGDKNAHIVFREQQAAKSPKIVEEIFTHEMIHIITGHSPDNGSFYSPDKDLNIQDGNYGLERLGGQGNIGKGLNEAMTEHLAQALISGDIEKDKAAQRCIQN